MKAIVFNAPKQAPEYQEAPKPIPQSGEVLVRVKASALNHRDVWISKGQYPGVTYPLIPGSDGAGVVEGTGQEVLLNPSLHWGDNPRVQGKHYTILGSPEDGCFAEYVKVQASQLHTKPTHLSFEQAAALPLGGLTAYRAVFGRAKLQAGERILISGIGGGVALFAFQFALAVGAEVYVSSGSAAKLDKAQELGAKGGFNYREPDALKSLAKSIGGFDVIVDSAGGDNFKYFLDAAAPGGRIVFYGGTRGLINGLSPQKIFWKQLSLMGTTMGNPQEFEAMLQLVERHQIIPIVDSVYDLPEGAKAFQRMADGLQFGKIVLRNG